MFAAILSTIFGAGGMILDKLTLTRHKVNLGVFLPVGFLLVFLMTLVLVPFFGRVDWQIALLPNSLFLLFLMVVIAIAWNVFLYQSIQHEKIHHHELIMMLGPIITVVLAAIFYPEEYDARIFYLALIASLALIFSKSQKEHFFTGKVSYNTFLGVVLMSTEAVVIRELLYSYTPVALYAIRTLVITIFFLFYYRPDVRKVTPQAWGLIGFSAFFGLIQMLARFYAYSELGLTYTTLISILGPIIIFLASWEILHEKIRPRVIFAALVILICVIIATVISFGS